MRMGGWVSESCGCGGAARPWARAMQPCSRLAPRASQATPLEGPALSVGSSSRMAFSRLTSTCILPARKIGGGGHSTQVGGWVRERGGELWPAAGMHSPPLPWPTACPPRFSPAPHPSAWPAPRQARRPGRRPTPGRRPPAPPCPSPRSCRRRLPCRWRRRPWRPRRRGRCAWARLRLQQALPRSSACPKSAAGGGRVGEGGGTSAGGQPRGTRSQPLHTGLASRYPSLPPYHVWVRAQLFERVDGRQRAQRALPLQLAPLQRGCQRRGVGWVGGDGEHCRPAGVQLASLQDLPAGKRVGRLSRPRWRSA